MIKVFQVIQIEKRSEWSVIATRSTREKAENVIKKYPSDIMYTVNLIILEVWTNEKLKEEWDRD